MNWNWMYNFSYVQIILHYEKIMLLFTFIYHVNYVYVLI